MWSSRLILALFKSCFVTVHWSLLSFRNGIFSAVHWHLLRVSDLWKENKIKEKREKEFNNGYYFVQNVIHWKSWVSRILYFDIVLRATHVLLLSEIPKDSTLVNVLPFRSKQEATGRKRKKYSLKARIDFQRSWTFFFLYSSTLKERILSQGS